MNAFEGLELEVDAPSKMVILHPTTNMPMLGADGTEAHLMLYSSDSAPAEKFRRDLKTARLRLRNLRELTGEKLEGEDVELLATLTTGWHLVGLDGAVIDLPFSRAEAVRMYSNRKMSWLKDQAEAFIGNRANFSRASSTT